MRLSILVVVYNMQREAPRTLRTLHHTWQRDVTIDDYEVIVLDNGSYPPLDPEIVATMGPSFRLVRIDEASASPAAALNLGARMARGGQLGIMIDGARMASPGVVRRALDALSLHPRAIVSTLGFHLGPDFQPRAAEAGFGREAEDELLRELDWEADGYALFRGSSLAGSSAGGWFAPMAESNLVFLSNALFGELGGFDERFDLPGGGMVNLDFYRRAAELADTMWITLLGEATFHQQHGGAATGQRTGDLPAMGQRYRRQYEEITGRPYATPSRRSIFFGEVDDSVLPWIAHSCAERARLDAPSQPPPPASEGLAPGSAHYRAYAGPPDRYDLIAGLSFSLMCFLGLRDTHRCLDIGCGSLRVGRLLIPYLRPDRYFGIEPNRWLVDQGFAQELGVAARALKRPRFSATADFDLGLFGVSFHFILAQSIFSHTGHASLRRALLKCAENLEAEGLLVATWLEDVQDSVTQEWACPGCNRFSWATVVSACNAAGLQARKLDWPHPLQTWFVAAKSVQRLDRVERGGVRFLDPDVVQTEHKLGELRAGRPIGFHHLPGSKFPS